MRTAVVFFLGAVVVVMNTEHMTTIALYVGDVLMIEDEIDNEPFPIYDIASRMWTEIKRHSGHGWRIIFGVGEGEDDFNLDSPPATTIEWTSANEPLSDRVRFIGGVIDKYIQLHTTYNQENS